MPAKFNFLAAASIALVPLAPLLACGGSSSSPDAHIVTHDSSGSGSGSGSGSACTFASTLGTPTFTGQGGQYKAGSNASSPARITWDGGLATPSMAVIRLILLAGCGADGSVCGGAGSATPEWPTTFGPKANIDLSSPNVTDAILIGLADVGSDNNYHTIYFATAGTLNVTKAGNASGTPFAATVANATLVHLDETTFQPAADGCMTSITSLSYSGSAQFDGKPMVIYGIDREDALRNALSHRWQ